MKSPMTTRSIFALVVLLMLGLCTARAQNVQNAPQSMRFFVTSTGLGKGGDLGGLAGADAHCQSLAAAVGAGTQWAIGAQSPTLLHNLLMTIDMGCRDPEAPSRPRGVIRLVHRKSEGNA